MPHYIEPVSPRPRFDASNWDVKVTCGEFCWYLHKVILRKCRYFSAILPINCEDDEELSSIELNSHDPGQLSQVLRFMYYFDYPGAVYDHLNPLFGDSVLTNTAMYLAGASVGHHGMMQFATRHIDKWTDAVFPLSTSRKLKWQQGAGASMVHLSSSPNSPLYEAVCDSDSTMDHTILRLVDPLYRALRIVYEQPMAVWANALLGLRVALIRFVVTALPLLAVNASFQAHFRNEWERPIHQRPVHEASSDKYQSSGESGDASRDASEDTSGDESEDTSGDVSGDLPTANSTGESKGKPKKEHKKKYKRKPKRSNKNPRFKPTPRVDGLSVVDYILMDYATFFDLHLVGWPKGQAGGDISHTLKPPQPSVGRTVALLRRLARNERSWIDDTPRQDNETGNYHNEVNYAAVDDSASGENIETRTQAHIDRDYRKLCLDTSLWDHEMTLGEIIYGLERIMSRQTQL
ncbi:hypothetical protein SEUCBS139899_008687 [Sporothrix eucalyptigena]|uniref:BTB domain-containing protein n=1 Tax=Sporothrix eucalyptigena TaxID=1812306 RepID=A0ABP0ANJ4_9PEZI